MIADVRRILQSRPCPFLVEFRDLTENSAIGTIQFVLSGPQLDEQDLDNAADAALPLQSRYFFFHDTSLITGYQRTVPILVCCFSVPRSIHWFCNCERNPLTVGSSSYVV